MGQTIKLVSQWAASGVKMKTFGFGHKEKEKNKEYFHSPFYEGNIHPECWKNKK